MERNGANMGEVALIWTKMALIWAILHYMGKIVLIWKK